MDRDYMMLERERLLGLLALIFDAYHKACKDKKAKIPTPLHLAVMKAHLEVGNVHLAEEKANAYANAMIKRDQERPAWERNENTYGASPRGGRLRPGS